MDALYEVDKRVYSVEAPYENLCKILKLSGSYLSI